MEPLAIVAGLWRYPVKSMAGEALDAAPVGWQGVAGDRRWAFAFADDRSDFPWFTGRRLSPLVRHVARLADPGNPDGSSVEVRGPGEGAPRDVADPALAEELERAGGRPLRLVRSNRGCFDAFPVSLIGTGTVRALGRHAGHRELDVRRFRPNVLVEADPFAEEAWLGATLQLGERSDAPQVRFDVRNERCAMVTIDPDTAQRDPAVQRAVVEERQNRAGLYATVVRPGTARVGDLVLRVGAPGS